MADHQKRKTEWDYMTGVEVHFRYILWAAAALFFVARLFAASMIALATAEIIRSRATIRYVHGRDK